MKETEKSISAKAEEKFKEKYKSEFNPPKDIYATGLLNGFIEGYKSAQESEGERMYTREESKWISVDERLPEDGQIVMIFSKVRGMLIQTWNADHFVIRPQLAWGKENNALRVTHWLPLPLPPSPKEVSEPIKKNEI